MKNCPFCKKLIPEKALLCVHCRQSLVERVGFSTKNKKTLKEVGKFLTAPLGLISNKSHATWNWLDNHKSYIPVFLILFIIFIFSIVGWTENTNTSTNPISTPPTPKYNPISIPPIRNKAVKVSDSPTPTGGGFWDGMDNTNTQPIKPTDNITNGTVLKSRSAYLQGDGKLLIRNGTNQDAVAKLIIGGTSIYTVYIIAGNTYTINNISDGYYDLVFALGNGWDPTNKVFVENRSYEKFEDGFNFRTYNTEDTEYITTHYTTFSVSLNPVIGGTAKTNPVGSDDFNSY